MSKRFVWICLGSLFIAAIVLRAFYLNASRFEAERQYRSAIIARAFYLAGGSSAAESSKTITFVSKQRQDVLEPAVTELLVSLGYRLIGHEDLSIPRILTMSFWIAGGVFLFQLARRLFPLNVAICATAYYLFVPVGVLVSISFLPDPLMMMLFLLSILLIVNYHDRPSRSSLVKAALASGMAILVKPMCLFSILGAFLAVALYKNGTWRRVIDYKLIAFLAICFSLGASYYAYGIVVGKFLTKQAEVSFLPYLLIQPEYWKGWFLASSAAVGHTFLIGALLGMSMLVGGLARALLIGLWLGYIVFGLVFTYHIRFATHYHLQLVVIVALSFAPIIDLILTRLSELSSKWYWRVPALGALSLVVLLSLLQVRSELGRQTKFENNEVAQEIGEMVGHSSKAVYLAPYYGMPLEYYGELSGAYWPRPTSHWALRHLQDRELTVQERIAALSFSPEYFIVTDFAEFNQHHADLREYLTNNCPLVANRDQYLIYGTCRE